VMATGRPKLKTNLARGTHGCTSQREKNNNKKRLKQLIQTEEQCNHVR